MKSFLVLSTVPSLKVAQTIAKRLVQARLAACVNIIPRIQSHFKWKGKTEKASESLLVIKTGQAHFDRLVRLVKKNHPYEVPEIIGFPIERGYRPYLEWIQDSLRA